MRGPEQWLEFLPQCIAEYGDIVYFNILGIPACLINHPAALQQVLVNDSQNFIKSTDYFALNRVLGRGLLTSEGDHWKKQRRLIQPAFYRERILSYGPLMTDFAARLVGRWQDGEVRDVHPDMMHVTLQIAASSLFSADVDQDAKTIGQALNVVLDHIPNVARLSFLPGWMPVPGARRFDRALADLDGVVYGLIRERRATGVRRNDLLSVLLETRDEDGQGMSEEQIRDEVMTLLLAGHETTANTLSWTLYLLAQHPEMQDLLAAEIDRVLGGRLPEAPGIQALPYTQMVLMEAQRLYPPAWILRRKALKPVDLMGYHLPAGTNMMISQWVVHRDARNYADPERFDPNRWREEVAGGHGQRKFSYLPFGAGPRVCVGASLALTESVLVLATLVQVFSFSLVSKEPVGAFPSITLRPKGGVRLQLSKRPIAPGADRHR